jgi:hypothetical protein
MLPTICAPNGRDPKGEGQVGAMEYGAETEVSGEVRSSHEGACRPMRRLAACFALVASGTILGVWSPSARADFYDLTGRYECLEQPDAVCYDRTPTLPDPRAWQSETAVEHRTLPPDAPAPKSAKGKDGKPVAVPVHVSTYQDTIDRIQARKPTEGDIALLQTRAKTGDPAALELLAWCEYSGVGVKVDAMRAYLLYGEAAEAGAPKAKANQQLIYGRVLTQDQRQKILYIQNGRAPRDWP